MAAKYRAHLLVKKALEEGVLVQEPCERCGSKRSIGHHDDYEKPLDVRWRCRSCHPKVHAEPRRAAGEPPIESTNEPVLTITGFARRLGVCTQTVTNWIDDGHIRTVRLVGGKRWIPQSELAKVGQRVDG